MLSGGGVTTVATSIRFPVRLVESGTHAELLALGRRYADLYRTQFADGERRTVEVG